MRQVSDEEFTGVLPSAWLSGLVRTARRRRVLLCLAPRADRFTDCGGEFSRCALRAFFHTLRAAAACLRARFASRLASFIRLRARLSSSLAIRTRCRATSACRRARSSGSVGSPGVEAPDAEASVPSLAREGRAPADCFSLAVFPMDLGW